MTAASGPAHVAIVGCGFTGTSALVQLVDSRPVRRITVFEASGQFGPGVPYRADECPAYLLNNTTDSLCLMPHNRQAFIGWLRGRGEQPEPKGHLSRRRYGEFLADAVQAACTLAAVKGIAVQRITAEVTALDEPASGGVVLHWPGGSLAADTVILATGRCPPRTGIVPPPAGSRARYVANHLSNPALDDLPPDATCHVLGASLSAYDVVNRLFAPGTGCRFEPQPDGSLRFEPGPNQRRVLLCSRSGRLKQMQSQRPMALRRSRLTLPVLQGLAARGELTLAAVRGLVDDEARAHGAALDWAALRQPYAGCHTPEAVDQRAADGLAQAIARAVGGTNFGVDLAADAQTLLWDAFAQRLLPPTEEARYRQALESAVLCFAAPCPVPTAQRLLALLRAGRLAVRHGVLAPQWSAADDAWHLPWALGTETARVLIDTRGALDRRVDSPQQPALIRQLHASGLLQPYRRGDELAEGAAVDMANGRAIGSRHVHLVGMWLWGPGFFTSSAFLMARVVQTVLDGLYPAAGNGPGAAT